MTARPRLVPTATGKPTLRSIFTPARGAGLLVTLTNPDGTTKVQPVTTLDAPGLELLSDGERGRIRSALLAVSRQGPDGGPRAA